MGLRSTAQPDLAPHIAKPYLDGVYLALNAIPDAALVVDAPSCVAGKVDRVQGNHDWQSTLIDSDRRRVFHSDQNLSELAAGKEGVLRQTLLAAAESPGTRLVLATAMSLVTVTGRDLGAILDELAEQVAVPLIEVRARDLYSDWLAGYGETLLALAKSLPLDTCEPQPDSVAIVGPLFTRNEADDRANVSELRSLVESLGLQVTSVWPSGESVDELGRVARAETIVSLPYGRKAAKVLARRLNRDCLDLPLPIGPDPTAAFLKRLAAHTKREAQAQAAIRQGEREMLAPLKWIVPHWLVDLGVMLVADPHELEALAGLLRFFGARIEGLYSNVKDIHGEWDWANEYACPLIHDPTLDHLRRVVEKQTGPGCVDLCFGDSAIASESLRLGVAAVEWGYASIYTHRLLPHPSYGYRGTLGIVERMINALGRREMLFPTGRSSR